MNVIVGIIGEGSVSGAETSHSVDDTVTLTATPTTGALFSYFQKGEERTINNPYIFAIASDDDVEISAVFIVTLEGYLRASVGFNLSDAALMKIRVDRGFSVNQDIESVTPQLRELSYADCLMYGVSSPSQVQGAKEADFGWSHQDQSGTLSITDKRAMRREAYSIYKRYGEKIPVSSVILTTLNGSKADGQARY